MLVNPGDVADGVLVNALWAVEEMVARPRTSRRAAAELDTARWADTERLIRDGMPGITLELPGLTERDAAGLEAVLMRDEVQGALQTLLAARLTDAPEMDAARAREVVRLALGAAEPTAVEPPPMNDEVVAELVSVNADDDIWDVTQERIAWYAAFLSEYFDDKISALVASLEGRVGFAGLAQVRAEAYNSRIVAVLGAIERQLIALADPASRGGAEAGFLRRYRRQVQARHGYLSPPDFDRRRRVPIRDIYVSAVIKEEHDERSRRTEERESPALTVLDLARRLDRTVLLGDPGGGKTTAASFLADFFATEPTRKVPFLVTLRDYAAKTPLERSVARHIEQGLETLYQCPAAAGLVEHLLLTGRAVVIFDGLDELLDTSHRRDVSERLEQFCSAYPLTAVLVTSRVVGYDQARSYSASVSVLSLVAGLSSAGWWRHDVVGC